MTYRGAQHRHRPNNLLKAVLALLCLSAGAQPAAQTPYTEKGCEFRGQSYTAYVVERAKLGSAIRYIQQRVPALLAESELLSVSPYFTYQPERHSLQTRYFDSTNFTLRKQNAELSLELRQDLPVYVDLHRRVRFSSPGNDSETVKHHLYDVRDYQRKTDAADKHLIIGKVRRKSRAELLDQLAQHNVDDFRRLSDVLHVNHDNLSIVVRDTHNIYAEITLDVATVYAQNVSEKAYSIRLTYGPQMLVTMTPTERKHLDRLFTLMNCELLDEYGSAAERNWIGYKHYLQIAVKTSPYFELFTRHPLIFKWGQVLLWSALALLLISLILKQKGTPYCTVRRRSAIYLPNMRDV